MQNGRPQFLADTAEEFSAPLPAQDRNIAVSDLKIYPDTREMLSPKGRVHLTVRELEVILVLVAHLDRVVTREFIYGEVWGGRMPYRDRNVDVYVRRVREKLRQLAPETSFVHTHFGIGYRFQAETSAS